MNSEWYWLLFLTLFVIAIGIGIIHMMNEKIAQNCPEGCDILNFYEVRK